MDPILRQLNVFNMIEQCRSLWSTTD